MKNSFAIIIRYISVGTFGLRKFYAAKNEKIYKTNENHLTGECLFN